MLGRADRNGDKYDPEQRLVSMVLFDLLKEGANGNHEALGWIFDDTLPDHKFRVDFESVCHFLNIDFDILRTGIESPTSRVKIATAKNNRLKAMTRI